MMCGRLRIVKEMGKNMSLKLLNMLVFLLIICGCTSTQCYNSGQYCTKYYIYDRSPKSYTYVPILKKTIKIDEQKEHPDIKWFQDAKFGLFVHWGLYAQHAGEWDLDALSNFDEDMLKDVGFDSKELDKIFQLDTKPEDDEVPLERPETSVKLG